MGRWDYSELLSWPESGDSFSLSAALSSVRALPHQTQVTVAFNYLYVDRFKLNSDSSALRFRC